MRKSPFLFISFILAVTRSGVLAVSAADLPACAARCVESSVSSSTCQASDIACYCKDQTFSTTYACCVRANCDTNDDIITFEISNQECSAVGVPVINVPDNACSKTMGISSTATGTGLVATTTAGSSNSNGNTNSNTSSNHPSGKNTKSLSVGAIAGIAVGGAVIFIGMLALLLLCLRRKKKSNGSAATEATDIVNTNIKPQALMAYPTVQNMYPTGEVPAIKPELHGYSIQPVQTQQAYFVPSATPVPYPGMYQELHGQNIPPQYFVQQAQQGYSPAPAYSPGTRPVELSGTMPAAQSTNATELPGSRGKHP